MSVCSVTCCTTRLSTANPDRLTCTWMQTPRIWVLRCATTVSACLRDEAVQVFNRFWRADTSRKRTLGGTGLGLSIAAEDVRLHGGTIEAWGE